MAEILEEPHLELRSRTAIRRPKPGERLNASVLRRFAQQGLRAFDPIRSRGLLELPTAVLKPRYQREQGYRQVRRFATPPRRAQPHAREGRTQHASCRLRAYGPDDAALTRFVQRREEPKIAKLQEIVEASEEVLTEMSRAIQSFAVPVKRMAMQDFLHTFEG